MTFAFRLMKQLFLKNPHLLPYTLCICSKKKGFSTGRSGNIPNQSPVICTKDGTCLLFALDFSNGGGWKRRVPGAVVDVSLSGRNIPCPG
jgi:hypothetical protein